MPLVIVEAVLTIVFLTLVGALVLDWGLWLRGLPTVTQLLREQPALYFWPAGLMIVFLAGLAAHLFLRE